MDKRHLKWRTGSDGTLECIDTETGEVVEREKKKERHLSKKTGRPEGRPVKNEAITEHWIVGSNGQKYWVPVGTSADNLPNVIYPYSVVTGDMICKLIAEGKSVKEIGEIEGYPSAHVIWGWARKFPEFKAELKAAREQQAEVFTDKIMAMAAEEGFHEKEVAGKRLIFDALKHMAQVRNPGEYGAKTKIVGDPEAPIGFIINTGIVREPKSGS